MDLAKSFGAEIDLLHCYQVNIGVTSAYAPTLPANFEAELREAASKELHEWREKAAASGVEIAEHLLTSSPSEGICSQAASLASDLIVMGTRGLSGLKHALLGSVAERVIRSAPCPVLTVKGPDA
jgi:nucleotide-binding universal stress UspA family protein